MKVLRYLKLWAQRWQPVPKCKGLPVKFRKQCLMNFQQSFVLARNTKDASTQNMRSSFSPKSSTNNTLCFTISKLVLTLMGYSAVSWYFVVQGHTSCLLLRITEATTISNICPYINVAIGASLTLV